MPHLYVGTNAGWEVDVMQYAAGTDPICGVLCPCLTPVVACDRALMQPIYRHYPEVKARHHMVLDRQVISVNETDVGSAGMTPSSGWLGEELCMFALHCHKLLGGMFAPVDIRAGASFAAECSRRIGAELHIFGYNWNAAHADTHSIGTEEALFRLAEQNGELVIHPTGKRPLCWGVSALLLPVCITSLWWLPEM